MQKIFKKNLTEDYNEKILTVLQTSHRSSKTDFEIPRMLSGLF